MTKIIILALAAIIASSATASAANFQEATNFVEQTSDNDNLLLVDIYSRAKKLHIASEVKRVVFNVHMHCASCVKKVQENIAFEKGVKDLKVSLDEHTVDILYDPAKTSEQTLKAAIEALGYHASVKAENKAQ